MRRVTDAIAFAEAAEVLVERYAEARGMPDARKRARRAFFVGLAAALAVVVTACATLPANTSQQSGTVEEGEL